VDSRILYFLPFMFHTFAAYAFCMLLYLQLRQYRLRRPSWGGWAWRILTAVFAAIYAAHLSGYVMLVATDGFAGDQPFELRVILRGAIPLVGPLLLHVFYNVERDRLHARALWMALIRLQYVLGGVAALTAALLETSLLPLWADRYADYPVVAADALLAASGLAIAAIFWFSRRAGDSRFRHLQRRWHLALVCALEASFVVRLVWWPGWLNMSFQFLPIVFMLATVYYGERLAFWDVFAKRGLFFFLTLMVLTCHFIILGPYLDLAILGFAKAWVIALSIVPFIAASPWAYSRLNAWVDRTLLGRKFTPMDSVRMFSESLQPAVGEDDLLERAELSLREIYRSEARVGREMQSGGPESLTATLRVSGSDWGTIRIDPRTDEIPFLSQDAELLQVLARALGTTIESEELRSQKLLQQQREKELALSAAQSELKALRAQINPHFLFNALNTIASLIPRRPEQAEQTVEQLSEVFRYTVRHADREWVRLADEIDFVNAYLDIEQTRFGERLQVGVDVDETAADVRIPAMVIQTLAENAVKHGVSSMRGPGRIAISARVEDSRLRVSVQDSGPGFPSGLRPDTLPEPSRGGYGLRNVRERLRAHYGPAAHLAFCRSETGMTEVALDIPVHPGGNS
jgi:two-component sensor histidine kinase